MLFPFQLLDGGLFLLRFVEHFHLREAGLVIGRSELLHSVENRDNTFLYFLSFTKFSVYLRQIDIAAKVVVGV
ncbi:MAG: hypothetical protein IJ057_07600 [Bacteroidales bacterium]|nr:hypothetical protein [Bacteroidales bacterium]